ncbi:hypothetical protein C8R43DRAFT_977216 [Mycena crocata]|nr:hypothetical protein C8R43DRAFT_977216 [Mycena crocata]
MSSHVVVVDERNPLIHYAGPWNDAGASSEFNSTTRWTSTQGSTASFSFNGTSISIYATVAAKNSSTASMTFLLDNSVKGEYTPSASMTADEHNAALWTSPDLSNDLHSLVITQTSAQADGVIYLDYLLYKTPAAPDGGPYFIDDRDPSVTYSPSTAWKQTDGTGVDFQHTSQSSTGAGDSLALKFAGRSVSFYGGVTSQTMNASMSIDGGPPVFYVPPPNAPSTNNLIFNSGDLADGNHTLVVTAQNDQPVWADYFLVTPGASSTSPSSSGSPSSSASTTGTPTEKSTSHTAAIAASVVGALVLISLVALAFILLRRRRRRRDRDSTDLPMAQTMPPNVTPFTSDHAIVGGDTPAGTEPGRSPFSSSYDYAALPVATTSSSALTNHGYSGSVSAGSDTAHLPWTGPSSSGSSPSVSAGESSSISRLVVPGAATAGPMNDKLAREARRMQQGGGTSRASVLGEDAPPPQYSEA